MLRLDYQSSLTRAAALVGLLVLGDLHAHAAQHQSMGIPVRGKAVAIEYYRSAAGSTSKGTVFMGSGDVGWVGLGVELAEFLSRNGYTVVGINVRAYLSEFSVGADHVSTAQVAEDYAAIATALRARHLLDEPVIVSGVSEGAALAVLAGSASGNHAWIAGVMTMGLPPTAELAWHWKDATSWITKKDPIEPSFAPKDFIPAISRLPLWMIQSTKDEYVTEADYQTFDRLARPPKHLVLIAASNHRFTDRIGELEQQVLAGLQWMKGAGG